MKRIPAIILGIFAIALSSCEDTYVYEGCSMQTIFINVEPKNWAYSGDTDNNYFYATVDMPEITKSVMNYGLVKMYRMFDGNTQMEMPYSRLNEEKVGTDKYFYTEEIDYEFSPGKITIFYTLSDFFYEEDESFVPGAMQFRCVIAENHE